MSGALGAWRWKTARQMRPRRRAVGDRLTDFPARRHNGWLARAVGMRLIPKFLDPASRLGEVMFGLIMVLSATLTANLTLEPGEAGKRQLLLATISATAAWGLIDAIMFVMSAVTERAEKARLKDRIHAAASREAALAVIMAEVEPRFEVNNRPETRTALCEAIYNYLTEAGALSVGINRADLLGGAACFVLVLLSCAPVVVLYILVSDAAVAIRLSNFALIAMLFLVGLIWARYANTRPLVTGLVMSAIGLMLVGVAILLEG